MVVPPSTDPVAQVKCLVHGVDDGYRRFLARQHYVGPGAARATGLIDGFHVPGMQGKLAFARRHRHLDPSTKRAGTKVLVAGWKMPTRCVPMGTTCWTP